MIVKLGVIEAEGSVSIYHGRTPEDLSKKIYKYVSSYWDTDVPEDEKIEDFTEEEAIAYYFEESEDSVVYDDLDISEYLK